MFLNENESAYIEYLKKKSVEFEADDVVPEIEKEENLAEIVQTQMLQDKDLVDKSQNAFVSYIRYYKEHQLQFIFAFNTLSIG